MEKFSLCIYRLPVSQSEKIQKCRLLLKRVEIGLLVQMERIVDEVAANFKKRQSLLVCIPGQSLGTRPEPICVYLCPIVVSKVSTTNKGSPIFSCKNNQTFLY